MKFWLEGYTPPSNRELIRSHWAKQVKMKHDVGWRIKRAVLGLVDDEQHTIDRANPVRKKVGISVFRKKFLDDDNLWGGVKFLVDSLKDNQLIYDDAPKWCDLTVCQRMGTGKEIGTYVEIT